MEHVDQVPDKSCRCDRLGPAAPILRSWSREIAIPHGTRLAIDHVVGYFGFTVMFWLAWPRPFVVGGILMCAAMLLEALQALTPDRCCDLQAAFYGVAGALAAALFADHFTRTLRRLNGRTLLLPQRFRPLACHLGIIHLGPADGLAAVVSPGAV